MSPEEPTRTVSRLPLIIGAAVVAALVLVTIAIVAASSPQTFEPGTPEAALQGFMDEVFEEDQDGLLEFMTPRAAAGCRLDLENQRRSWSGEGMRAQLDEIEVSGDRATAMVELRRNDIDDPFDGSGWSSTNRYVLLRIDGDWLVDFAQWPWPLRNCTDIGN